MTTLETTRLYCPNCHIRTNKNHYYLVNVRTSRPWNATRFTTETAVIDYLNECIAPLHGGSWGPWTYATGQEAMDDHVCT